MMNEEFRDAAIYGDFDTVRKYLDTDSTVVFETDEYGFTVLHDVVGEHNVDMVNLLIKAGANVNAQNDDGIAPLHLAAYDYIAEALLNAGAELELKNKNGETPLFIQSTEPDAGEVLEALLKAGANPEEKNKHGKTPIEVAQSREEVEKVELLQSHVK